MMNDRDNPCDALDDYLAGELPPAREAAFREHLDWCAACRMEVDGWAAIAGSLKRATCELESPDADLWVRIEHARASRQYGARRRRLRCQFAAAACVAGLVIAGFMAFDRSAPRSVVEKPDEPEAAAPLHMEVITPSPLVELPDDVIGVPIDVGDPNVTVVWVYPTVNAAADPE